MREFIDMVTEAGGEKESRARLRTIKTERKYLMSLCMDAANRAALNLAEDRVEDHAAEMEKIARYVKAAADFDKEADRIIAALNGE